MVPVPNPAPPKKVLPYGAWASTLSVEAVIGGSPRYGGLAYDHETVFWTEGRAELAGRTVLVRARPSTPPERLLTSPWNVRSRVHEYGGGAYTVAQGQLWFSNDEDGAIYRSALDSIEPHLFFGGEGLRFADLKFDVESQDLYAVMEDHRAPGLPQNSLVRIDGKGRIETIAEGDDFYSNPLPMPNGIAWLSWRHPNMPWDGTRLYWQPKGEDKCVLLAGGDEDSIFQPTLGPDGRLFFVSDRSGWWNLYAIDPQEPEAIEALCPLAAEFGVPQWEFGMRSFGLTPLGEILAIARSAGTARLGWVRQGRFVPIALPFTEFRSLQVSSKFAVFFAGSPTQFEIPYQFNFETGECLALVEPVLPLEPQAISTPQAIRFSGSGGVESHAFFYPPASIDTIGPPDELPPVIVMNHGGPTSATSALLRLAIQFWTTRGFAVADLNYGGSTGYGRMYRERLRGQWGVVDVEDAVMLLRDLGARAWIDSDRTAIRGSSAGGFTALAAMTFHSVFKAGVSLYGIGDLSLLAMDTHKFEARYMDRLIAPWPEGRSVYETRSPIKHIDQFKGALLLLQGAEDKVVPPNQANGLFEALKKRGVPVAYCLFEGEQHGFRRADTLKKALQMELSFYGKVFDFEPAEDLPPLTLENFG